MTAAVTAAGGPYFDDLKIGDLFDSAPAATLTSGLAAIHQSIVGDRLRLPMDEALTAEVCGQPSLAHPALVWDLAIGQSTVVSQRVVANLFYRGLTFRRMPAIGDTLRTVTEVIALRANQLQPGRRPTGLAALRIRCADQHDRPVLDFWRCAMLPVRDGAAVVDRRDDLDAVGNDAPDEAYVTAVAGWRLDRFRRATTGAGFADLHPGQVWQITSGDVVSGAPELARMTLNVAAVHHDSVAAGPDGRLVYGGHVIGLALSQACRVLPNLVTVTGWQEGRHLGPVHEGDTLRSVLSVDRLVPLPGGGGLVHLRSQVRASAPGSTQGRDVLDWRFAGLMA